MEGKTNVAGSKLFAAIGVTYPAGSTLTCTNGTKTLKAKTTSGQWVFAIPEVGTWTLEITDGTRTKSQSVNISTEGQSENVKLVYWGGTLYDAGDEYAAVTGGWIAEGMSYNTTYKDKVVPTVTRNADNIVMNVARTNAGGTLRIADKVYIADYTKLTADIFASDVEFCSICFWTEIGTYRTDNLAQEIFITNKTRKTIEAAITLPAGEYYVGLVGLDNRTITMYSMKLS